MSHLCLGIDIGTTNCCVGVYYEDKVHIVPNEFGCTTTPSYMAICDDDEKIIGENAKIMTITNPHNVAYDIKRILGKFYDNIDVQRDMKYFSYKIENTKDNTPSIKLGNKNFSPEEICANYITKMKDIAESYTGLSGIKNAVLTVPAYFNDLQRFSVKLSAEMAGLNILRIINEPTAAAIAYNLNKDAQKFILVFDMGGGTLDISLLEYTGDENIYNVLGTCGDMHMGGEDFDNKIYSYCLSEFLKKHKLDIESVNRLLNNSKCKAKLKQHAEIAKKNLSVKTITNIFIEEFFEGLDLTVPLSRTKFEDICSAEFSKCKNIIWDILKLSSIDAHAVDSIVLVGGATRMPKIKEIITNIFNKAPNCDMNPDETVAYGATILAQNLNPTSDSNNKIILIDVVPMTLGIEVVGGIMVPIIEKNTQIPCSGEYVFGTYSDNQYVANIKIYQGNSHLANENMLLDKIELSGIKPLPRGCAKIHVKFVVDVNGMLNVSAYETSSNVSAYSSIHGNNIHNSLSVSSYSKDKYDAILYRYKLDQKLYECKKMIGEDSDVDKIIIEYIQWYNTNHDIMDSDVYIKKLEELDRLLNKTCSFNNYYLGLEKN